MEWKQPRWFSSMILRNSIISSIEVKKPTTKFREVNGHGQNQFGFMAHVCFLVYYKRILVVHIFIPSPSSYFNLLKLGFCPDSLALVKPLLEEHRAVFSSHCTLNIFVFDLTVLSVFSISLFHKTSYQ